MIYNTILDAIGNTPLIKLNRMTDENSAQILVKFEGLNVGGSIKTRTAYNMILDAEKKGIINKDTIIVEPTSGNQGIGLALVGAVRGYKTVIIMPDSVSEERRKLVKHYGAEVKLVHDSGDIGEYVEPIIKEAETPDPEGRPEASNLAPGKTITVSGTSDGNKDKAQTTFSKEQRCFSCFFIFCIFLIVHTDQRLVPNRLRSTYRITPLNL